MGITAASNTLSLMAQGKLGKTTTELSTTFERLSSGMRINKASDDPAGLALADGLHAQATIATVAIRNANDGLSVTAITDQALAQVGDILVRLGELATQSANGVYTEVQRSALSTEFLALGSEVERIAATTTFNGINLLSNSSAISFQVGLTSGSNAVITMASVVGTLSALGIGTGGRLTYSVIAATGGSTESQSAARNALDAVNNAIATLGTARGTIGAVESRLNVAVNNLVSSRDNFMQAESRIRDADIAQEAANMVRLQVLQQAGTAVIAQANQQPKLVLDLLR